MKYAVIGLAISTVVFFFFWISTVGELSFEEEKKVACQSLATEIDDLLREVDGDYEVFINSITNYWDGHISEAMFSSNLDPLITNRERLEFKYDKVLVKYNDKCFGF
jgi:arabinogalactan endo-1,4-beta-galactosidase